MAVDDGKEKVLCLATEFVWEALARAGIRRPFNGFQPFGSSLGAAALLDELEEYNPPFLPRTSALERDEQYKQLIPYAYLRSQGKVWLYRRVGKAGDKRLQQRSTAGVGGHVNPEDAGYPGERLSLSQTLLSGLRRELSEEVRIPETNGYSIHLDGLINDDSDSVGRVHLGIVYRVELAKRDVRPAEDGLLDLGWHTPEGLSVLAEAGGFEGWSRILVTERLAPAALEPA